MRHKIVAGNWKMNKGFEEGIELILSILHELPALAEHQKVIFGTPYIHLQEAADLVKDMPSVHVAAQNCHQEDSGAHTGEISASMLASMELDYIIIGHSERRKYFQESDELLATKVNKCLDNNLIPIFCCGEELDSRKANQQNEVVSSQLKASLFHLDAEAFSKVVIAYEPVWAIGTGETASPEQAQEMHAFIRAFVANKYGNEIADDLSILYGGSCKPSNAEALFSQPDVDGGLIGGASLKEEDFLGIIKHL